MDFPANIDINLNQLGMGTLPSVPIRIHGGITTFLGPNGSGKTQLLRGLKTSLASISNGRGIRYVSSGRLGPLENFRSDFDGQRGGTPRYDLATYGDKSSMSRRHRNETVLGDFASLSERPDILIKVQERLRKLFNRNVRLDWDGGTLKVFFSRVDTTANEYSSAREASGLLHMVAILAALYDNEIKYLLIDEPEVSLHPQLQSFVYQEISKVAGDPDLDGKKLVFISTHSTEFVHLQTVDDLASIVFCSDVLIAPVQIDPTIAEFRGRKIQALLSKMGQEHKLALFCERPLLVEGPSDQIICSGISRKLNLNTEAAGSQILPVTGKGQMPVVTKLMRLIGKTPSVLADADALTDGLELISSFASLPESDRIVVAMGHRDASQFSRDIYRDFTQQVDSHWGDIRGLAELHPYWINRDTEKDERIAQRRSAFSVLMSSNQDTMSALNNTTSWNSLKLRLNSLLDLLAAVGCFILKRGTVEAYYVSSDRLTSDEKPNAAVHEILHMDDLNDVEVNEVFGDIVKAIKYASQAKEIKEGAAIRDMVLSIVTPALASLTATSTQLELNSHSRNLFGNIAGLFRLDVEHSEGLFLVVHLSSSILDVEGFPLRIAVGANPITAVNMQMNLS